MKHSPVTALVAGALLLYPFVVYFGSDYLPAGALLAGILCVMALRIWLIARARGKSPHQLLWWAVALLVLLAISSLFSTDSVDLQYVRLYPVLVDAMIFSLFFGSLFTRQPLVERIARAMEGELPAQAIGYTRRVTWVWCAVLLFNTAVSFYTTWWTSLVVWTFYNGFLSYLLVGVVFAAEYLVRCHLRRAWSAA